MPNIESDHTDLVGLHVVEQGSTNVFCKQSKSKCYVLWPICFDSNPPLCIKAATDNM